MDWQGKNVLVTGAGGFIGSHLVEELTGLGANVTAFVRYTSKPSVGFLHAVRDKIQVFQGDFTEYQSVYQAMKDQEHVFHLGALIGIPYSLLHPDEVIRVNTVGTMNVLAAARQTNPLRIVLTSTSEVYGTAKYVPIDETHPLQAQSPYAASKIGADKLGEAYYHAFQIPISIVRPFNTFGPRQSARAVIPTIILQSLKGEGIFLGVTSPIRDFTFVKDTVRGFIQSAESDEAIGEIINIGAGREISIGDLAAKITSLMGKKIKVHCDEHRIRPGSSEVMRLCCNNEKARSLLGWQPHTSLEEGLKQTIAWLKESHELEEADGYRI